MGGRFESVGQGVTYVEDCRDCGGRAEFHGGQSLIDGRLCWSVERHCRECGDVIAECGKDDLPDWLRERMLAEGPPARLVLADADSGRVPVMKVLRSRLGIDLGAAGAAFEQIKAGEYAGTLPEMALLVCELARCGVSAEVRRGH